jgi:uncharacterized protein YaaN involved in tellurite resistance
LKNIFISDNSSLHGDFLNKYPEPATSPSTLDLQQKSLLQEQQKHLKTFQDSGLNSDKENVESFGNNAVRSVKIFSYCYLYTVQCDVMSIVFS